MDFQKNSNIDFYYFTFVEIVEYDTMEFYLLQYYLIDETNINNIYIIIVLFSMALFIVMEKWAKSCLLSVNICWTLQLSIIFK